MMRLSAILLVCLLKHALSVPLVEFYEIDATTTSTLGADEDAQCSINVDVFFLCGDRFNGLCVLRDGGLQFWTQLEPNNPLSYTPAAFPLGMADHLAAPFWCDIATRSGTVTFGSTKTDTTLIARANDDVRKAYPFDGFAANEIFVATWSMVTATGGNAAQTNTFQVILATNAMETYVIHQYLDSGINWNMCGANNAQAGITSFGDSISPPASGTADISRIEEGSNIGDSGIYVYRVHNTKEEPTTCTINNIQYKVGETFLQGCTQRCVCQANGVPDCQAITCPVIDGPVCVAWGDPHYTSWDRRVFNFQGTCEYPMAQSCGSNDFVVSANNVACSPGSRVSCIRGVRIKINQATPNEIYIGQRSELFFDGVLQAGGDQTYTTDDRTAVIRTGGRVHVTLRQAGIYLTYDGLYTLRIQVATSLLGQGKVCGLCGNYNGIRDDDPISDPGDCPGGVVPMGKRSAPDTDGCDNSPSTVTEAQTRCGVMRTSDVFSECRKKVDPEPFITSCEFDYCCGDADGRESYICSSLSSYAAECTRAGAQPSNWRGEFCPVECPNGMVFQQCGPFCPQTCENVNAVCEGRCAEGCYCPSGQVQRNGRCIDPELCTACEHNGVFVPDGQQIQMDCSTKCTCRNQSFVCETQTCLLNGPTCVISGDPHYQTYDLRSFSSLGACEYVVSRPCNSDEFIVSVRNSAHNSDSTRADQVTIVGGGLTVVLGRSTDGGTVSINGVMQANTGDEIIRENDDVQVLRTGGHLNVIFPTHGVRVFWDGRYRVEITVSTKWRGQLCGLCGNYNGDDDDDNIGPDSTTYRNRGSGVTAFVNSWVVGGDATGCDAPLPPLCGRDVTGSAQSRCRAMVGSFFEACNDVVDPESYQRDCISDQCNCDADDIDNCFCESLATYASACAAKGVALPDWRTFFDCSVTCPANMVYQQCGSICPQVCENSGETCISGCAEGCFCPVGMMFDDNGDCVQPATCPGRCPVLTAPDNGMIDCSSQDECSFSCNNGFTISGSTVRMCQDDDTWSGTQPTCTREVRCARLTAPDNGDIDCSLGDDGEANPGDTCTFTCDDGFDLSGSASRTCRNDGSWSGSAATCSRVITCPPLTAPVNGDIDCSLGGDGEANPGETCTFTCDGGFELGGSSSRTCTNAEDWSGTTTSCTTAVTTCPQLTAPDNGAIDCSLGGDGEANPGDTCTFTCDDGFGAVGSGSRICTVDGSWSGTQPTCRQACSILTAPDNGDIDCSLGDDGEANPGDTCTFTCDDGHELSGRGRRTCRDDGTWSGLAATCAIPEIICRVLTAPDNGDVDCSLGDDGEANPGDTCTFKCNTGFGIEDGSISRTCQIDGTWSGRRTECGRACQPLTAPDNGDIDCSLGDDNVPTNRDSCTFTCDDGFRLRGSTGRNCRIRRGRAQWTGDETTCAGAVLCQPLTAPDNGDINCNLGGDGVANLGDTCSFTCDDGFRLVNDQTRTCAQQQNSGRWSGTRTECRALNTCPTLTAPVNGSIDCSLGDDGLPTNRDTCTFTCDDGYGRDGPSERTCEFQSGQIRWSGRNVSCNAETNVCPTLPTPANGRLKCGLGRDGFPTQGDVCRFLCDDGFTLEGRGRRMCQLRNGVARWTGRDGDTTCVRASAKRSIFDILFGH